MLVTGFITLWKFSNCKLHNISHALNLLLFARVMSISSHITGVIVRGARK